MKINGVDDVITSTSADDIENGGLSAETNKIASKKVNANGNGSCSSTHMNSTATIGDEGLPYPLDIVVQNIQDVVANQSLNFSDDEFDAGRNTTREINHVLKMHGFKVDGKDNGADCEIVTFNDNSYAASTSKERLSTSADASYRRSRWLKDYVSKDDGDGGNMSAGANSVQYQGKSVAVDGSTAAGGMAANPTVGNKSGAFCKGHRRAYSMPNAHRERAVLVVADDRVRVEAEGARRRHVVRYRLHPYKPSPRVDEAVNTFIDAVNLRNFSQLPLGADDGNDELEMEIDENEIICSDGHKVRRTFARRVPSVSLKSSHSFKFWEAKWKRQNFEFLPEWLQDNEFLRTGHRPPLASFTSCFKSIFSLHTETGNIWTHMYGCVAFIGVAAWFLSQPSTVIAWHDKAVFTFFFIGAIICLGFSFTFHTLQCHSKGVAGLFSKLDYSGISMLIVGSFVPWIYYGFYCRALAMTIYISMITILGFAALIVSLWDKFAAPKYRPLRGAVFLAMGLSGVIPAMHLMVTDGFRWMFDNASLHWLLLMGALYIIGACIYMTRFPERCYPGRCDYFCHSHQFFHMFVIIAAFVHFHGITEMAMKRLEDGSCTEQLRTGYGTDAYRNALDRWFRPY